MRNSYSLFISPGFALLAVCGAGPVRKHAVSGEMESPEGSTNYEGVADSSSLVRVEPREDIMNFEGVAAPLSELSSSLVRKTKSFEHADISSGLTSSTPTRKIPKRQTMEVHANGHIEPPADVLSKMNSLQRVLELQSESHDDKQRRIYELEAELEAAKAACAERDRVKLTHGLLESNVHEPKTEVIDGEAYQVMSESVRWAATEELVKLYYGGSFDLLQTDLHRNRKAHEVQLNPAEFDTGESFAEKDDVHMQPAAPAFHIITSGTCSSNGYVDVVDATECQNNAPVPHWHKVIFTRDSDRPNGCIFARNNWVGINTGSGQCTDFSDVKCVCKEPPRAYEFSAFNVSDCPRGTYRIESGSACATAALSLGRPYQFMGQATYHSHPRGCSADNDSKITFNFAQNGFPSMSEQLLCAKSNTCATHRCPEGQQHKLDTDNLANPTDGTCCEQTAAGANCMVHTLCEEELGTRKNDTRFMCECVRNKESQRNKTLCEQWLMCLHNTRGMVQVWFKELLEFVRDDPIRTDSTAPRTRRRKGRRTRRAQSLASSNAQDADCTDPSLVDVFSLDCQCAETLQQACGGWIDRQQCLIEFACASDEVCDTWKQGRCVNESAESLIEGRLDSRAGSTIGSGSKQTTDASAHVGRGDDGYFLDEAVQRKCR